MAGTGNAERLEPRGRFTTTLVLALGAVGAAVVCLFGEPDSFRAATVAAALLGLVPWALEAGGVRVPPAAFATWSLACAAVIVLWQENPGGMFPVMILLVWLLRTTGDLRITLPAIAVSAGLIIGLTVLDGSAHESGMVYFLGGIGISAMSGLSLRRQELLMAELQAMNELRVEHAATEERARIARDVHDVVAHSLTVVMLNLTGARRAMATDPQAAADALLRAELVGRESLDSIREVMGLLREPGQEPAVPGLGDVVTLVERHRAAGLDVEAELDDRLLVAPGLDQAVGLVAYRIVQESLTNALRHAAGAPVRVVARAEGGRLAVTVGNGPGRRPDRDVDARTGLGLRGMSERARAVGGELRAGPTADGGWEVAATIPLRREAPPSDADPDEASDPVRPRAAAGTRPTT